MQSSWQSGVKKTENQPILMGFQSKIIKDLQKSLLHHLESQSREIIIMWRSYFLKNSSTEFMENWHIFKISQVFSHTNTLPKFNRFDI